MPLSFLPQIQPGIQRKACTRPPAPSCPGLTLTGSAELTASWLQAGGEEGWKERAGPASSPPRHWHRPLVRVAQTVSHLWPIRSTHPSSSGSVEGSQKDLEAKGCFCPRIMSRTVIVAVKVKVKSLSCVWLFATPRTVAHQAPPSMGFSRREYWSGLPLPSPRDLPDPGIKLRSPTLQADALPSEPRWKPPNIMYSTLNFNCYLLVYRNTINVYMAALHYSILLTNPHPF